MGTKEQIRNKMIEERSKLSKEEKQRYSNLIMDRLILYLAQKKLSPQAQRNRLKKSLKRKLAWKISLGF